MEMTGALSLLVCLVGVVIYFVTVRPKLERVGWHMFLWGMVIFLYCNCGATFNAMLHIRR